jgi:hypothetical protein
MANAKTALVPRAAIEAVIAVYDRITAARNSSGLKEEEEEDRDPE